MVISIACRLISCHAIAFHGLQSMISLYALKVLKNTCMPLRED